MSNQDGRVIINIDSNAVDAAKEFERLHTQTQKYNDTLKKLKATGFSETEKTLRKLKAEMQTMALSGLQNTKAFKNFAAEVRYAQNNLNNANNAVKQAISGQNNLKESVKKSKREFSDFGTSTSYLNNLLKTFSVGYVTKQLYDLGAASVKTNMDFQALTNRFNAAAGDKSIGNNSLEYIRKEADRLGLSFKGTADSFAGFEAAALRSGLKLGQTKQIFSDVSTAATSMQLPAQNVELTFKALEQIAGKGTVSMEELRQQLGDHLPGAFEIAAKSMNMTTREFYDAVSAGKVLSSDFLPKFTKALKDELGGSATEAATQLRADINRLNTSMFDLGNTAGQVLTPATQTIIQGLTKASIATQEFISQFASASTKVANAYNEETTKTINQIQEYKKLLTSKERTTEETNKLKSIITELSSKYPEYIGQITQELKINGELSSVTSSLVRAEMERSSAISTMTTELDKALQKEELLYKIRMQTAHFYGPLFQHRERQINIQRLNAESAAYDESTKALRNLIKQRKNIEKLLINPNNDDYTLGNPSTGTDDDKDKNKRDTLQSRMSVIQDKLQKLALAGKQNTAEFASLTAQYNKYKTAVDAVNAVLDGKGAYERLQANASESVKKLQDLAASNRVNTEEFRKVKKEATDFAIKIEKLQEATKLLLSPYDALNDKIQTLQKNLQKLAAQQVVDLKALKQVKEQLIEANAAKKQADRLMETDPQNIFNNLVSDKEKQYKDMVYSNFLGLSSFTPEQIKAAKNQFVELANYQKRLIAETASAAGLDWSNVSSSISTNLASAITTPLQEGENALERFGNVALNTFQMVAQSYISSFINAKMMGAQQNGGMLKEMLGQGGFVTGGAAQITELKTEMDKLKGSIAPVGAAIAQIGGTQSAAIASLKASIPALSSSAASYRAAAVAAQKLASSITQAAIAQAAFSAAKVPVAGAALAPIAAMTTGASIGAANMLASAGMLASRITAFKNGGVIDRPTFFPMKGNRTGLAGEAGLEAIMPLRRTSDGRLGVEAANVSQPNIHIYNQSGSQIETVQRPDGDYEIFIRKVNNALNNERTNAGFTRAMQRNSNKGIQAC